MIEVRQTRQFSEWFTGLRDTRARAQITVRIDRLILGNPDDVRPVGEGVSELRIGLEGWMELVILLCGVHKGSQRRDIAAAKALAKELENLQ
ncbi:MAG: hypothetical protein COB78_13000 [Hyphomicrobiales bacterium]|nr:MAG: hypothetical protein COB78_13000 [Hyphomicrobiales bacterium]